MTHLTVVPPPPGITAVIETFAVANIGGDIFVCRDGQWEMARAGAPITDALLGWVGKIAEPRP